MSNVHRERHVSVDHVYKMREHYRCVVVTDYRVGDKSEPRGWLHSFVCHPGSAAFFFIAVLKEERGRERESERKRKYNN